MILYWSEDNGQLYDPDDLDFGDTPLLMDYPPLEGYLRYDVNSDIKLTWKDCCAVDGSLLEALLETKQAKLLDKIR